MSGAAAEARSALDAIARRSMRASGGLLALAVLIGVLGAAGNVMFRLAIDAASTLLRGTTAGLGRVGIPLALLAGGLVLLLLERLFPGDVLGYGFPRFLEMLHLQGAQVKRRWITLRTLGAAVSLGAGAAVGREGPIAQIGGAIGGMVAGWARLALDERKVLIACGVAAGVAATFDAPIGAILFAQEIVLLGDAALSHLSLVVVAAATAVATTRELFGVEPVLLKTTFVLPSYLECVSYAMLGLVLGLLAVGYTRAFHRTAAWVQAMPYSRAVVLLAGLALLGAVDVLVPQNVSDGYPVINDALAGQLTWGMAAVLAVAKIGGSILSLACGVPGGVFGPIFFIGAMTGVAFRALSEVVVPQLTGPHGSYALVGLGAFLAATTHAPLTGLFLLIEMTEGYGVTVPALLAIGVALLVAQSLEPESIDTYGLHAEGKTLARESVDDALERTAVGVAHVEPVECVRENASLPDILRLLGGGRVTSLPVVDGAGRLTGVLSFRALRTVLGEEHLGALVIAADLCDRRPPTVTPKTSLGEAFRRIEAAGLEEIPVVEADDRTHVVGVLSRASLIAAYNRVASRGVALGAWIEDTAPAWSGAYRVREVPVPEAWVGRTLRAIGTRERFGVTILAVHHAGGPQSPWELPDPDRPLARGDTIVLAGTDTGLALVPAR